MAGEKSGVCPGSTSYFLPPPSLPSFFSCTSLTNFPNVLALSFLKPYFEIFFGLNFSVIRFKFLNFYFVNISLLIFFLLLVCKCHPLLVPVELVFYISVMPLDFICFKVAILEQDCKPTRRQSLHHQQEIRTFFYKDSNFLLKASV